MNVLLSLITFFKMIFKMLENLLFFHFEIKTKTFHAKNVTNQYSNYFNELKIQEGFNNDSKSLI